MAMWTGVALETLSLTGQRASTSERSFSSSSGVASAVTLIVTLKP
jgi:hypothetical protein